MSWYIFRLNEDKDWVKIKKVCETLEEAKNYVAKHRYQYSRISNIPEMVHKDRF